MFRLHLITTMKLCVLLRNLTFDLSEKDPFYLTEHRNPVSRGLHIVGTTIFFLLVGTRYRRHIPNLLIAVAVGAFLCEFLAPLGNGMVEFVAMLATVAVLARIRQLPIPWMLPLVGYSFAWIGHFFFENNRPATFIYPCYSLLCDFLMWRDTVLLGRIPLSQTLDQADLQYLS